MDDDLVDTDPVIRPLLEKFICVRQVSTNGFDLETFQFDTDQSFVVFFLAADKTIYGRFGTRSHQTDWLGDVSLQGLAKALRGALDLHENREKWRDALSGKQGKPLEFSSPELYPALKNEYTDRLNYQGDLVKSCIHCHQIGDARRDYYWSAKQAIPEKLLWPYPHPKMLGLILDPDELATVKEVQANSIAKAMGFFQGDKIRTLTGQPLVSIADVQWVLHNIDPAGANVPVVVERDGEQIELRPSLEAGWRVSTWGLRRIAAGGMSLEVLSLDQRAAAKLAAGEMGLHVKRLGKYGAHATGLNAGFKEGDLITEFDGQDDLQSEQQLLS